MTHLQPLKVPSVFLFLCFLLSACNTDVQTRIYQQESPYDFEDSMQNLDIAISEYNYRIIHRSNIGQAIRDRGDKNYPLSTVVSFCNITYAKEMMEINSDLINDMPCIITVREEGETVIIGTQLMNENTKNTDQKEFSIRINANLRAIIASTIE